MTLCLALVSSATALSGARPSDDRSGGLRGDGGVEHATVSGVRVAISRSPVEHASVRAADGARTEFLYRKPAGRGPLPAVVLLHGGVGRFGAKRLRSYLLEGATHTRLLSRGYVVVAGDYRDYRGELQSRGPILDVLAVIERVRQMPFVDAGRIAVFGGSGGGSIALEVAGETAVGAVVAGEPATIILAGLLDDYDNPEKARILRRPLDFYTPELRTMTRAKLERIETPILLLMGGVHQLKFVNRQILIPELEELSKELSVRHYPGNPHGFYWGNGTDADTLERVVGDVDEFLRSAFSGAKSIVPDRRETRRETTDRAGPAPAEIEGDIR